MNLIKLLVRLVLGVYEVFYFCHHKFSDSQQAHSWTDLISESIADLGCGEWQLACVEVQ